MIDVQYIKQLIDTKNVSKLAEYMKNKGLFLNESGNIVSSNDSISSAEEYWDKRQLVRKILLNSALIPSAIIQ